MTEKILWLKIRLELPQWLGRRLYAKICEKTLKKLNYKCQKRTQSAPHQWTIPIYGKNWQFAPPGDNSEPLDKQGVKQTLQTVGSFLYYARVVNNTILTAINDISAMQAHPTKLTSTKIQMLLDYLHTYPNARVCFYASDMQLRIDSNAAYLVAPKAKSRIAGFFYCSDKPTTTKPIPKLNGPVHVKCRTLRHVVTSAAEVETAALFFNTQTALEILHTLQALGHHQRDIPVKMDNETAASFVNDT